jgi:hypothetical protein
MKAESIRFTKIQRDVLELLRDGGMISVDSTNMSRIGDREVSFQTRNFLTGKRLVRRRNPNNSVGVANGFVISENGLAALEELLRAATKQDSDSRRLHARSHGTGSTTPPLR